MPGPLNEEQAIVGALFFFFLPELVDISGLPLFSVPSLGYIRQKGEVRQPTIIFIGS